MNTGVYYFLGGRVVISGSTVTLPTGLLDGYSATDIQSKRSYLLTGNSWVEQNPVAFRVEYDVSSNIPAQTLIGISGGYTQITGSHELQVFYNGILLTKDSTPSARDRDYHLSGASTTGIRLNWALPPSGKLTFIGYR